MKKKKKFIIIIFAILVLILLIAGTLITIYQVNKSAEENKGLTFYLPRSNTFSSNWSYEISDDNILLETDHDIYDYLCIRYDYWEFRPRYGSSGEVTIYFYAQYQTRIVEENCFSITYYVDENSYITEVSNENKPSVVNYDDNIAGLILLKTVDWIQTKVINFFVILLP